MARIRHSLAGITCGGFVLARRMARGIGGVMAVYAIITGKGADATVIGGMRHNAAEAVVDGALTCAGLRASLLQLHPELEGKDESAIVAALGMYRRANRWKHNPDASPACARCSHCFREYAKGERGSVLTGERYAGMSADEHAVSLALDATTRQRGDALRAAAKKLDAADATALRERIAAARERAK